MKPTRAQREMMQEMSVRSLIFNARSRKYEFINFTGTERVNYWTADGARHRGLIEVTGVDGDGCTGFKVSSAGRAAVAATRGDAAGDGEAG